MMLPLLRKCFKVLVSLTAALAPKRGRSESAAKRNHGTQLQSARAGCGGMRHLHAAAKWELRGSSGVARQRAAGCRSLCTSPNIPGGGPLRAGEHGRDRWRTSEASLGLHWPSGRYRGYRPACCLLLWLLLRRRQRPLRAWLFTSLRDLTCRRRGSFFGAELDRGLWKKEPQWL